MDIFKMSNFKKFDKSFFKKKYAYFYFYKVVMQNGKKLKIVIFWLFYKIW